MILLHLSYLNPDLPLPEHTRWSIVVDHALTVSCLTNLHSSHAVQLK
jgi:hypothetical protein